MLQPMLKLIRNRGRGLKAPALLARPNLFTRLVHATRGYAFLGVSVSVAAVVVVSLLTWLSGYVDNAIGRPTEVIERVLPGVLEQVDDQLATLIGADEGTVQGAVLRSAREGLAAVSSAIPQPGTPREATANPSTNATTNPPAASDPTTLPRFNAATPAPGSASPTTNEPSSKTTDETPSQRPSETPSSARGSEEPPPATQEPSLQEPPPQEPSPETPPPETPPLEPPPKETPPQEMPPPVTEEPPPTVTPPPGEFPSPPVTESPPPVAETPPPAASEPPPTPKGV